MTLRPLITIIGLFSFLFSGCASESAPPEGRPLSSAELEILQIVRDELGQQNSERDVFFTDDGGAAIFAKSRGGSPCIMLHLTNLAEFIRAGQMTRADVVRDIRDGCGDGAV